MHDRNYSQALSVITHEQYSFMSHEPNMQVKCKIPRGTNRYLRFFVNLDVSCTVSTEPFFNNIGVNIAGPLYVRDTSVNPTDSKETNLKVYVCLFTCASTGALHLELTRELSATVFLQVFGRFCGRRGVHSIIMSDNARTFISCSKKIEKLVHSEEVHQCLTNKHVCKLNFIVEKAPWWGVYWERLVRSVKHCLRKVVRRSTLTFDEMSTVLVEVEATLNNRPLTYVHDNIEGLLYVLTPVDLVYGYRLGITPSGRQFKVIVLQKP